MGGKYIATKRMRTVTKELEAKRQTNAPPSGFPHPMPGHRVIKNDRRVRKSLHLEEPLAYYKKFHKSVPIHAFPTRPENKRVPKYDTFALEHGTNPRVENFIKTRKNVLGSAGGRKQEVRNVVYVKDKEWAHIVERDQNACIVNEETGEIQAYVIRNFFGDKDIIKTFNESSREHCKRAKNVRDGDPGNMCLFGYSAGNRAQPRFMVARNLFRGGQYTDQEKKLHNHRVLSAHTLIWSKARKFLPPAIVKPMEEEMHKEGMPGADWGNMGKPFEPIVSFQSGGRDHELTGQGLECGIASGLCSSIYARACHFEHCPKDAPYVISYTAAFSGGFLGGSFYIQDLGVLIRAAEDTLIVHRGSDLHGTTVHDVDFTLEDYGIHHRGYSMYCKKSLPGLWREYMHSVEGRGKYDSKGRFTLNEDQVDSLSPQDQRKYWMKMAIRRNLQEEDEEALTSGDEAEEEKGLKWGVDEEYTPPLSLNFSLSSQATEKREGLRHRGIRVTYSESDDDDEGDETPPAPRQKQKQKGKQYKQVRSLRAVKANKALKEARVDVRYAGVRKSLRGRTLKTRYSGF